MQSSTVYVEIIKKKYLERLSRNSAYSLRAFAKDLDINPSTLSQVLKFKRKLPKSLVDEFIPKLKLSTDEVKAFKESYNSEVIFDKLSTKEFQNALLFNEDTHSDVISWEYLATLELFEIHGENLTKELVGERLNKSFDEILNIFYNLETLDLIKKVNGKWVKVHKHTKTTEDISSSSIKKAHEKTLNLALEKMHSVDVHERDYSSSTIAIDVKKLPEAKTLIREFRKKMMKLLVDGEKSEVYQLAVQFFPLSEKIMMENKNV